jgi:hypothetical protein
MVKRAYEVRLSQEEEWRCQRQWEQRLKDKVCLFDVKFQICLRSEFSEIGCWDRNQKLDRSTMSIGTKMSKTWDVCNECRGYDAIKHNDAGEIWGVIIRNFQWEC